MAVTETNTKNRNPKGESGDHLCFSVSRPIVPLVILLFTAAFIGINQYGIGIKDHCIRIPFLKAFADSGLYGQDYMVACKNYLYTIVWPSLGMILRYVPVSIEWMFFGFHVISIYGLFYGLFYLGKVLFGRDDVSLLAMTLLLFRGQGLGAVSTASSIFLSRNLALPFLIFAVILFLKEKWLPTLMLLGIGFLIHPLSSGYVIIIVILYLILHFREIDHRQAISGLVLLLAIASPIFLWRLHQSPQTNPVIAPKEWEMLLRLRSPHHVFPFLWPRDEFFRMFLFIPVFLAAFRYKPERKHHQKTAFFMAAIFLLCLSGTVFTEWIPLTAVIQMQLFRVTKWILFLGAFYYANFFITELSGRPSPRAFIPVAFLSAGVLYNAVFWKEAFLIIMACSGVCFIWVYLKENKSYPVIWSRILLTAVVGMTAVGLGRHGIDVRIREETTWRSVQEWARHHTPVKSIFIVPPGRFGFRIGSERAIYGDWMDGTMMFLSPDFGFEWIRRMRNLGFEDSLGIRGFENLDKLSGRYNALSSGQIRHIAAEFPAGEYSVYLVMEKERQDNAFRKVYRNGRYTVYKIVPGQ